MIPEGIQTLYERMVAWRHHLHAHPELAYEEFETSDFIAGKLEEFGIEVTRGLASTGVIGTIKQGESNRAIGLRADMDALPMQENNDFAHKSQNTGCMHACGHDGHTAMLLGAAAYLAEHGDFDGTVHFIFQPAEEAYGGGDRMVKEGLFEKFPVDGIYGMHNWPGLDERHFGVLNGPVMASVDEFKITVTGVGGHAAMPNLVHDPFVALNQVLAALYAIPSRRFSATDSLVISVTQVHGGTANNVIPDEVVIMGTVRTLRDGVRSAIEPILNDMAAGIAQATATSVTVDYERGYPVTTNHDNEAEKSAAVAAELVGVSNMHRTLLPSMGAEDFAYMLQACPGSYIWLGNGKDSAPLHNTSYDFNDGILATGAAYWANLAQRELAD